MAIPDPFILTAAATVNVTPAQAQAWFLSLRDHPERYRFATHAGFRFTHGSFGEVGARFETQERFWGARLTLRFELCEVGAQHFRFRLLAPPLPLWGAFIIAGTTAPITLRLEVGATTRRGAGVLRLLSGAIRPQIQAEVDHIQTAMETLARPA